MAATLKQIHQDIDQAIGRSLNILGVIRRSAQFLYTDTVAKEVFKLPKGAIVLKAWTDIVEAFDSGTTHTFDFGIKTTDPDGFTDDGAAGTVARVEATYGAAFFALCPPKTGLAAESVVVAKYIETGTAATAGIAEVTVLYIQATDQ